MSQANDVTPLLNQILSRLVVIEEKLNDGGAVALPSATARETQISSVPKAVTGFQSYCREYLDPFVASCTTLADAAGEKGAGLCAVRDNIKGAWEELGSFIAMAAACKKPNPMKPDYISKLAEKLKAAPGLVKNDEWNKHAKTCGEGISSLNWIFIEPAPCDFIESYVGGSDYWANGIRKEFKQTNKDQIAFCDTFKKLLTGLMAYVKEYHKTGVTWKNSGGMTVDEYISGGGETAAATASSAPANVPKKVDPVSNSKADDSKNGLFASLNKGGAITSGLKTVTKDMQTWRKEYTGSDKDAPLPKPEPKKVNSNSTAVAMKHPPRLQFQQNGNKWWVEYQTKEQGLVNVDVKNIKENIYIYGCVDATIQVNGKCSSIVIDGCKKTNIYFDICIASVEVVNSRSVKVFCKEKVNSVAIDKTDGIVVTLPRSSLDTEIVASKSSEMNLSWPDENDDMVEKPIPEQYVHKIKGMTITADVSELYSS